MLLKGSNSARLKHTQVNQLTNGASYSWVLFTWQCLHVQTLHWYVDLTWGLKILCPCLKMHNLSWVKPVNIKRGQFNGDFQIWLDNIFGRWRWSNCQLIKPLPLLWQVESINKCSVKHANTGRGWVFFPLLTMGAVKWKYWACPLWREFLLKRKPGAICS